MSTLRVDQSGRVAVFAYKADSPMRENNTCTSNTIDVAHSRQERVCHAQRPIADYEMTTPRIEAIALVGSRNQRIYMATRAAALHDKQQKQQREGANDGDVPRSGPSSALTTVRMHDEVLRLEYAAHCALDVVEERSQIKGANGEVVPSAATYLGLVLTMEDLAIYAMTTSTKLRILLVLCPGEARMRDIDCVTILRAIHTSYLSYISNPCLVLPASQGDPNEGARLSMGQANAQIKVEGSPIFDRRIAAIGGWA